MKLVKTLALAISCSLLIAAPVFAGQKHINTKNGYEIKLVDGDISAMSSDFALTMDSKTQTAYFVGGTTNELLGNYATVKFNDLYALFSNTEKLQGGGPIVINAKTYKLLDDLLVNNYNNANLDNLFSKLKQVELTCTTSTVNKLPAIHFEVARLNSSKLGKKLPFGVNEFYLVSKNNIIYILGTISTQNLPSKDTKKAFSRFLQSFKIIKPSNINKNFGYNDAIAGYYLPLPNDWFYIQGKLGKLSNFTVAMPIDTIFAIEESAENMDKTTIGKGDEEDAATVKKLLEAFDEGIVAFSSRKPLAKNSVPYQLLNNIRDNDAASTHFFVEKFKDNLENELNKHNISTNYIATASNYNADNDLVINLKSELLYDKNFPIIFNSKIYINNNFLGNINYIKHTNEKNAYNSNSALIRHIDKLTLLPK